MQGYRAIKIVGEGSFGEVWLVHNSQGEPLALKYLRFDKESEGFDTALSLFKREFELLCELKHAHLARVLDFGFDPERSQYFLVSEFCEGKKISEISPDKSLEWWGNALRQVLSALDYIHNRGVVHLDIKPENVLVQESKDGPIAKLIDFGVATRLRQGDKQGYGGSPAYMAPELLGSQPMADPRADLYSLGMLCLEALTGRLPFDVQSRKAALEWHREGSVESAHWSESRFEIPKYLRELVDNLLAKNPKARFSSARSVLSFLDLAGGGAPSESRGFHQHIPLEGPLVGREDIQEKIRRRIEEIFVSNRPAKVQVNFLTGELGIGKSRLLQEARHFAALHEIPLIEVRCDWESAPWPKLAEELGLPPLKQDNPSADWQLRRKIDALRERGKEKPFFLLIDDFHKAGPDFRSVFMELAKEEAALPEPSCFYALAATQDDVAEGWPLRRLDADSLEQYVEQILGPSDKARALGKILWSYSGGLPLLMSEGLRYLAPRFQGDEAPEELRIPGLASIYEQRLLALPEEERQILEICALIFRPVQEDELLRLTAMSPAHLRQWIDPMLEAELLSRHEGTYSSGDSYQIANQALALELIDLLPEDRRKELHRQIAKALNQQGGSHQEELGYHLAKSGQAAEAVPIYRSASEALLSRGELASASRCLEKALRLLSPEEPAWRELQWESARLAILTGNFTSAEALLLALPDQMDWKTQQLLGWLYFKKRDFQKARLHYDLSLEKLPEEEKAERIIIENALGNVDLQTGNYQSAAVRFGAALEKECQVPPESIQKGTQNNLGIAMVLQGSGEESAQFYERRLRQLGSILGPEGEISLLNAGAFVQLRLGRYEAAVTWLKKAMLIAEESGALHSLSSIMGNLITSLLKESRYAESLPLLQKTLSFQQRLGNNRDVAYNFLRQGSIYLTLGMAESAQSCLTKGRQFLLHTEDPALSVWFSLVEGYWEREHGQAEKADALIRQAEKTAREIGNDEIASWALYAQADMAYDREDFSNCQRCLESLGPAAEDKEFLARLHLLQAKLVARTTHENEETLFSQVESECMEGHFREILGELYLDWALSRKRREGTKAALPLLEQGRQIVEAIADSLPEEYKGRYLNLPRRRQLLEDWMAGPHRSELGWKARIKGFLQNTRHRFEKE